MIRIKRAPPQLSEHDAIGVVGRAMDDADGAGVKVTMTLSRDAAEGVVSELYVRGLMVGAPRQTELVCVRGTIYLRTSYDIVRQAQRRPAPYLVAVLPNGASVGSLVGAKFTHAQDKQRRAMVRWGVARADYIFTACKADRPYAPSSEDRARGEPLWFGPRDPRTARPIALRDGAPSADLAWVLAQRRLGVDPYGLQPGAPLGQLGVSGCPTRSAVVAIKVEDVPLDVANAVVVASAGGFDVALTAGNQTLRIRVDTDPWNVRLADAASPWQPRAADTAPPSVPVPIFSPDAKAIGSFGRFSTGNLHSFTRHGPSIDTQGHPIFAVATDDGFVLLELDRHAQNVTLALLPYTPVHLLLDRFHTSECRWPMADTAHLISAVPTGHLILFLLLWTGNDDPHPDHHAAGFVAAIALHSGFEPVRVCLDKRLHGFDDMLANRGVDELYWLGDAAVPADAALTVVVADSLATFRSALRRTCASAPFAYAGSACDRIIVAKTDEERAARERHVFRTRADALLAPAGWHGLYFAPAPDRGVLPAAACLAPSAPVACPSDDQPYGLLRDRTITRDGTGYPASASPTVDARCAPPDGAAVCAVGSR